MHFLQKVCESHRVSGKKKRLFTTLFTKIVSKLPDPRHDTAPFGDDTSDYDRHGQDH